MIGRKIKILKKFKNLKIFLKSSNIKWANSNPKGKYYLKTKIKRKFF